jgi:hypothetical protein
MTEFSLHRYFVVGSALSILIPIPPLVSLFSRLWGNADILPVLWHTVAYGLLAMMGVLYTLGE